MGLRAACKAMILKGVFKKRQKNDVFDEAESEKFQLPDSAEWDMNNSYYFTAHTKAGDSMFFRYAQRGGGAKAMSEVWFAYRAALGETFVNETRLFKLAESPMKLECVKPLREWKFNFKGKMFPAEAGADLIAKPSGKAVDAEWAGVFTSENKDGLYEFSRDTDPKAYCKAVAAEKWTKGFSSRLQHAHQIHIEQNGHIAGTLKIGGKVFKIDAEAIRDHSYGRRAWSFMNRHTWLIGVMEDGSRLNVNEVFYPVMSVRGLKCGYRTKGDIKANVTDARIMKRSYQVKLSDKTRINCAFKPDIFIPFEFDDMNGGYTIYEGISSFEAGGLKGRGITEFGYNKDKNRYKVGPYENI